MGAGGSAKVRGGRKWAWPAQVAEKRPKAEGGEEVRGSGERRKVKQKPDHREYSRLWWLPRRHKLSSLHRYFADLSVYFRRFFFFFEVDLKGPAANSQMSSLSQTAFLLTGQINSTGCPLLAHQAELALTETEMERKESRLAEGALTLLGPWFCQRRKKKNKK